ncbi:MAG: ABC transporter permease [Chitinophagaceae bacterium]|nr:ABC transporter permease [Chitinophagaceae bacterium]
MIKNYFKLGWRNLLKNKLSSIINIVGLGLAVGCCLVVFVFLDWSINQDDFHSKLDKLYVVERIAEKDGNQQIWGDSPAPMGNMLKNDFPQIKNTARLNRVGAVVKQGDNVFREEISFVDDAFYSMFDFPVKWGNKLTFSEQDGIVLTEELSEKLFGKNNSVGKNVNIRFSSNGHEIIKNFTVKGVFEKQPKETSFYFAALVPFNNMVSLGMNKTDDWSQPVSITFLETEKASSVLPGINQSKKYVDLYNDANKDSKIAAYNFQPLKSMSFHSYKVINSRFSGPHIIGVIMLLAIAISILLLVCFNYMNIAIASASSRLKEIGIRKVMGSNRKQIIFQFILENLILCTAGVFIGLFLAKFIFLPWFSQIANIDLAQKLFENVHAWWALLALIFITVLGGAAYPSIYISALKPISIVRGSLVLGSKNRFRKTLLGFQFFFTFLGISMALAFIHENTVSRAKPWGYEPANNVVVKLEDSTNFQLFKTALKSNNAIASVTGSVQSIGNYTKQLVIKSEGKEQTVQSISALPGFASQLGIKILSGRDLSDSFATDQSASVLVNQAFLKQMKWQAGIGKTIEYDNKKYSVVGEINDFRFENFQSKVQPLVLLGCKPEDVKFVYVKTSPALLSNAHSSIEKTWKAAFPNLPFDYYYQDTVFDGYFSGFAQVAQVMTAASLIMIIVSVFGIFGLALLILGKKMKALSVRKVLGAGRGNISFQIIKEFLSPICFALVVGVPASYLLTKSILVQVTPESNVSFAPLIISLISLVIITVLSLLWHLYKAFTANPTAYLKNE